MRNEFQKFHIGLKAIIKCSNEILLIKTSARGDWEFPGGRIDDGENYEVVLGREIFEETGITLNTSSKELIHINIDTYKNYIDKHNGCKLCLIFYEIEIDTKPEVKLSHEHIEYKWVKINMINKLNMSSELKIAILETI